MRLCGAAFEAPLTVSFLSLSSSSVVHSTTSHTTQTHTPSYLSSRCSGNGAHYPGRLRCGSAEPRLRLCCRLFSSALEFFFLFIPLTVPHTATHLFTVFLQHPVQYSNRPDYTPPDPSSREGHRTA